MVSWRVCATHRTLCRAHLLLEEEGLEGVLAAAGEGLHPGVHRVGPLQKRAPQGLRLWCGVEGEAQGVVKKSEGAGTRMFTHTHLRLDSGGCGREECYEPRLFLQARGFRGLQSSAAGAAAVVALLLLLLLLPVLEGGRGACGRSPLAEQLQEGHCA